MHRVGDVVRLNRGWTPMIVLHISEDEELYAIYARRNDDHYPITLRHYENYRDAYSYHRHTSEFTAWDGKPINTEWNYIMTRRYRTTQGTPQAGVYMNTTSNGDVILEMDITREIKTFNPLHLEEDIPDTFRVRNTVNNYSYHYEVPSGVDVQVGDVLITDNNNIVIVLETKTKSRNHKGLFNGRRLVTEHL